MKAVWGVILVPTFLIQSALAALYVTALASILAGGASNWATRLVLAPGAATSLALAAAGMFGVVLSIALLAASLAHLFLWSGLPPQQRTLWLAVLLVTVHFGMLVYWFVVVLREPLADSPAAAGVA